MPRTTLLVGVLIALAEAGCGGASYSSNQPSSPSTVPSGQLPATGLVVTGRRSLAAIGETTQLTAVVTWTDGTTRDVTADVQWQSLDPSVVAISPRGLATALAFGAAVIEGRYQNSAVNVQIGVTPEGTFAVTGSVREPGQGAVEGVRVLEPVSGRSTLSDRTGGYTLSALISRHLKFEKDGYDPGELDVPPDSPGYISMQRTVRIAAGGTAIVPKLTHNDLGYDVGPDRCSPCRLIRIASPTAGTMHFEAAWEPNPGAPIYLWVGGRRFGDDTNRTQLAADAVINAGENIVYVGYYHWTYISGSSIKLTLATAMSR